MKRFLKRHLPLALVLLAGIMVGCSDDKTYAELLQEEKDAISKFITDNQLEILNEFPEDSIFTEKQYVKVKGETDYLYLRIIDKGDTTRPKTTTQIRMQINNRINIKTGDTSRLTPPGYPFNFTFGLYYNNACEGFALPLRYVGNGSRVSLIVPSKLGLSSDKSITVTPFYYDKIAYYFD